MRKARFTENRWSRYATFSTVGGERVPPRSFARPGGRGARSWPRVRYLATVRPRPLLGRTGHGRP
jgi:hypothetical protein